jgi:hypothetical protein
MHHHNCKEPLPNKQVCGQLVAVVEGQNCADCGGDHRCSIHHADPQFRVEPTPPLTRNKAS